METAVRKTGLVDQASKSLREYILSKGFKPGDVLPGEMELAAHLGVSRTIIREALSRFRLFGIIDSRRRRGMVLQSPDILRGMEMAMVSDWLATGAIRELFEFRLIIEVGLADLLFARKNDRLIRRLERIIEKEKQADSDAERIRADAEFHAALYSATRNETLIRFQSLLYPMFRTYACDRVKGAPKPVVDHARLLHELVNGSPTTFRLAMRHHLEPHFAVMQADKDQV